VTRAARQLALQAPAYTDVPDASTRLYATPVIESGKRYGAVVAGVSLKPYEQTRRTALYASLGLGAAVLLLVALTARWLLASSLRPVARMTRLASEWSERDLDRRFAIGEPRDELTDLAATLDGLLDRLAASLRREQRFSAELSHELRTPLSRVIAGTELALRRTRTTEEYRSALELVHRNDTKAALREGRPMPSQLRPLPPKPARGGLPSVTSPSMSRSPSAPSGWESTVTWPSVCCSHSSRTRAATAAHS
jgi:signal transduction histidine kinase